jgi:hypothetical protein
VGIRSRTALVVAGVFFVGLAALSRFYAYPQLAEIPLDSTSQNRALGPGGTMFDRKTISEITIDLENVRDTNAKVQESKDASEKLGKDVVVFDTTSVGDEAGYYDSQWSKRLETPPNLPPRTFTGQRIIVDRKSGEPVVWDENDPEAVKWEYIASSDKEADRTYIKHEGLTLKFPFRTEKKTYQWWDSSTKKAWPAEYKETTKLEGLTVYRFEQNVPVTTIEENIDTPASVVGAPGTGTVKASRDYKVTRSIWIEPTTGSVIKGAEHPVSTLQYNGQAAKTLVDVTIEYVPDTVKTNAEKAKSAARGLMAVRNWVPLAGLVIGLGLLGTAVLASRRRPAPAEQQQYADEE